MRNINVLAIIEQPKLIKISAKIILNDSNSSKYLNAVLFGHFEGSRNNISLLKQYIIVMCRTVSLYI